MSNWANVAELTKVKNLEGGLVVRARAGLPFLLEEGMDVCFVPPVLRIPRTGKVKRLVEQGDGRFVVYFDSIPSIDEAEKLVGHFCLVKKADLPEGWDESAFDLSGLAVQLPDGQFVGTVIDVLENPAHPLLELERQNAGNALVPLVDEFIVEVDEEAGVIVMDLPAGLLEL